MGSRRLALSALRSSVLLPCQGPRVILCDAMIKPQHALGLPRFNIQGLALWQVERFAAEVQVLFWGLGAARRVHYLVSEPASFRSSAPFWFSLPPHKVLKTWFVKNGSERRSQWPGLMTGTPKKAAILRSKPLLVTLGEDDVSSLVRPRPLM